MTFTGRRKGYEVKKGVQFTISGTGCTTFMNALCKSEALVTKRRVTVVHVEEGIRIKLISVELEEVRGPHSDYHCG